MFFVASDAEHNGQDAAEIGGGIEPRSERNQKWTKTTVQSARLGGGAGGIQDVADAEGERGQGCPAIRSAVQAEGTGKMQSDKCRCDELVHDTMRGGRNGDDRRKESQELANGRCWATEPDVGRVAHGIPARVDRLKCLGNAVVPQQAYPIFKALMMVFEGMEDI